MSAMPGLDVDHGLAHDCNENASVISAQHQTDILENSSMQDIQHKNLSSGHSLSPSESNRKSVPITSLLTNRTESPPRSGPLASPYSTTLSPFASLQTQHKQSFDQPPRIGQSTSQGTALRGFGDVSVDSDGSWPPSNAVPDFPQLWTGRRKMNFDEASKMPHNPYQHSTTLCPQNHFSRENEEPQDSVMASSQQSATSSFSSTAYPLDRVPDLPLDVPIPSFPHMRQHSGDEVRKSEPPPLIYDLRVRQHPAAARACGYGERDRRVIDPPPIVELQIRDRTTLESVNDPTGILALHCDLITADRFEDKRKFPGEITSESNLSRQLIGTLMASQFHGRDEAGAEGVFFVFPDLSCRNQGNFRLHFKLFRIDTFLLIPNATHPCVASVVSDVFTVYTAKTFPGMRASSALLRSLRSQGLNVSVRKGASHRRTSQLEKSESESDEVDSRDGVAHLRRGSTTPPHTSNDAEDDHQDPARARAKRRRTITSQNPSND